VKEIIDLPKKSSLIDASYQQLKDFLKLNSWFFHQHVLFR
jgi:hypothetical protein